MKQAILNNLKNIYGWKTKRKIVVISVDDYGNVRLDSKNAREKINQAGLKVKSRFDAFDTMETREDLELLFETLTSVKGKNGRHAVFTPFALPCNIDFEKVLAKKDKKYEYELLPVTFEKLEAKDTITYKGTWNLWKEGIDNKIMLPQFHGREHLNIKVFEEKLAQNDEQLLTALENRSYTGITNSGYATINYTAAFDFWDPKENQALHDILIDGMLQFKNVFGYTPNHFMPSTSKIHPTHYPVLKKEGINYIDTNLIHRQHQGFSKYRKSYNYTGKKIKTGQIYMVRNIVFEPTDNRSFDWVNYTLKQIETAFHWNRPAVLSSHRVNFCGYIDDKNRKIGIDTLKELLKKIVKKWPDVEFMAANELGDLISNSRINV